MIRHTAPLLAVLVALSLPLHTDAVFSLSNNLGDGMVLQKEKGQVWGFAPSVGDVVTVQLVAFGITVQVHQVTATNDPTLGVIWVAVLNTMPGSMVKYGITATTPAATNILVLTNVMFGDVYVCGGQSNMEFTVPMAHTDVKAALADAVNWPNIILFRPAKTKSTTELHQHVGPHLHNWTSAAEPKALGVYVTEGDKFSLLNNGFSATCYFFGLSLYQKLVVKVPIGLIGVAYSGTHIGLWEPPGAFDSCKDFVNPHLKSLKVVLPGSETRASIKDWVNPHDGPHTEGDLWNGIICPMLRLTVKGTIWYQGESDAFQGNDNFYPCWIEKFVATWRARSAAVSGTAADAPFFIVQLGPWGPEGRTCDGSIECESAPMLRLGQTANFGYLPNSKLPNTFLVTAVDLGDITAVDDLHPKYKQQVGERLANSALRNLYNYVHYNDYEYPYAISASILDTKISIEFANVPASGLVMSNDTGGFEVYAGCTWQYLHTATVLKPSGTGVEVSFTSASGTPTSIRYNFFRAPCNVYKGLYGCTLYTSQNLPVLPFLLSVKNGETTMSDRLSCALEKLKENLILVVVVVICAVVFLACVVGICCYCCRRKSCSAATPQTITVKHDSFAQNKRNENNV